MPARSGLVEMARRTAGFVLDCLVAGAAFLLAYFSLFYVGHLPGFPDILAKTAGFVVVSGASFLAVSLHRTSWRYVSVPDVLTITKASIVAVVVFTVGAFLITRGENIPRSVLVFTAIFMILGLTTCRVAYRLAFERRLRLAGFRLGRGNAKRNVLLCGFSDTAESFIRAINRGGGNEIEVVGIVDEQAINRSRLLRGIKVRGSLDDLPEIVSRLAERGTVVTEIIVTENAPSRERLGRIVSKATDLPIKVSRLPSLTERAAITSDSLLEPKPIEIGDLLGRPEVRPDTETVAQLVNGRTVLVTGAGGSIGSELCRQIASFGPRRLIITDSSEFQLYTLDKELRLGHPNLPIVTCIADVRDAGRIGGLVSEANPEVVFHAAALKHVPLVESNPVEGIKTNVLGTCNVADAALASGASTFVMISTDKAVNPTNIMGATKRAAEAYCQCLDVSSTTTRFKTVRFGNVLGSNGSVVPHFQEQIAAGGPVTVTHPDITRYFMTIPEAVRLVLQASAEALSQAAERGKIMILDMGRPIKIVDLAERMIQLAGFKPGVDIEIVFTGLRPGEKLYEELFDKSEVLHSRTADGFVVASPRVIDRSLLEKTLAGLRAAVEREDESRSVELLRHIVPEYRPAVGITGDIPVDLSGSVAKVVAGPS